MHMHLRVGELFEYGFESPPVTASSPKRSGCGESVQVDAYFWLKTPGESDGCTALLPDGTRCARRSPLVRCTLSKTVFVSLREAGLFGGVVLELGSCLDTWDESVFA